MAVWLDTLKQSMANPTQLVLIRNSPASFIRSFIPPHNHTNILLLQSLLEGSNAAGLCVGERDNSGREREKRRKGKEECYGILTHLLSVTKERLPV